LDKPKDHVIFNCISAGTPVSLSNGLSVAIEDLRNNKLPVLSYDRQLNGIVHAKQTEWLPQGKRDCVQLTLSDGRTLVCTPDHQIRTTTGDVKAADLVLNHSKVICGGDQPLFTTPTAAELKREAAWTLVAGGMKFSADTPTERDRAMTFCRLVGYILTDGCVSAAHGALAYLGHELDVKSFVNDIQVVVPKANITPWFEAKSNLWCVQLPPPITKAVSALPGIVIGSRMDQPHQLPDFVSTLPKSLLREFLGGLFGGDGHTVTLTPQKSGRVTFGGVRFSQSATVRNQDSLIAMITQIIDYLAEFGVNATISNPSEEQASKKSQLEGDDKTVSVFVLVSNCATLAFAAQIGYRYCVHKAARLATAITWRRLQAKGQEHNNKLIHKVYEITGYEEAARKANLVPSNMKSATMQDELKKSIVEAYDIAIAKLTRDDESFVASFITVKKPKMEYKLAQLWKAKEKEKEHVFTYVTINPMKWLKKIGALQLFSGESEGEGKYGDRDNCEVKGKHDGDEDMVVSDDDQPGAAESRSLVDGNNDTEDTEFALLEADPQAAKRDCRPVTYSAPRGNSILPTWTLTVVDYRPVGPKEVYDISVPEHELFIANGVVVHNCMHLCLCEDCVAVLSKRGSKCPMCSKRITKIMKVFV
jgi:intein/homing endonuclease